MKVFFGIALPIIICTIYFSDEFDKTTYSYTGNSIIKINTIIPIIYSPLILLIYL